MEDIEIVKTAFLEEKDFIRSADIYFEAWFDILKKELNGKTPEEIRGIVRDQFSKRTFIFPEGQLSAYCHSLARVVGNISSLRVSDEAKFSDWNSLTGKGYFNTHNDYGNSIVCPAVNTDKSSGIKGVAKKLVLSVRDVAIKLKQNGLENMFVFTRPSGYGAYVAKYGNTTIEKYLETKLNGNRSEFPDPIDLHVGLGAKIIRAVEDARPADNASLGYCVLMRYEI